MALNFFDLPVADSSNRAGVTWFRAGKCVINGSRVSADPRKGRLQIAEGEDGLTRVQWLARGTGVTPALPEEDLIVINDAYLERIPQCADGRVYCLRFTSSDKKLLFWMQEPDASRDEFLVAQFNSKAGGAPSSGATARAGGAPAPADGAAAPAGGAAAAAQAAQAETASEAGLQVAQQHKSSNQNLQELRRLLADYSETLRKAQRAGPGAAAAAHLQRPTCDFALAKDEAGVSLGDVLDGQMLRRIGEDPRVMAELMELMPENLRSAEDVRETLQTPQLAAAMRGLTQALYTDPAALLSSMGVATASNSLSGADPVAAFAHALEQHFRESDASSSSSAKKGEVDSRADDASTDGSGKTEPAHPEPHICSSSSSSPSAAATDQQREAKKDAEEN